jgi:hypothetical protein
MTLVSTTIPNLINGVSQQPYALRLSSQAEVQINGYSSVVEGLRKRPPTKWRANLSNTPLGKAYIHTINRDSAERYVVVITNGNLRVFDMNGVEKAVNFPSGRGYLSSADADTAFTGVTVADYTFILNRNMVAAELPDLSPTRAPEALVWVKQGAYALNYTITLHGYVGKTVTTPNGSDPSHAALIATDRIASDLANAFAGDPAFTNHFHIERAGSTIRFLKKDGGDFTISYSDGLGDQAMKLVKGAVQRFSDLPSRGFHGFRVQITGDSNSSFDDYWVEYNDVSGNPHSSVWIEALKGGERYRINPNTMPHGLVREANGTFTFKPMVWEPRKTGDNDSNPFPSLMGKTINDIFFHRNRLGMIADENVVFSRAGDFFNLFKTSATQLLDSDVIDIAVSHTKVSILRHAIAFNESLLLFSDQTQFMLATTDMLTPNTVAINQTTEFQASLKAKPVGAGRNVYFPVNKGSYSGLREYYVDGETRTNDAADVTSHVPNYVPGNITKLAASTNEDVLVALSPNEPDALYVYKYYWQDAEKLQSAWSKWKFAAGTKILSIEFIENELWLVCERGGQVTLEMMSLDAGAADPGLPFVWHLDQRCSQVNSQVIYDPARDVTTIIPPYTIENFTAGQYQIVGNGTGGYGMGQIIPFSWAGGFVVAGDLRSGFWLGRVYEFRYKFSTLVIKEEAPGGGQMTVGEGKIQLRKMTLTYNKSGYFRTLMTPERRQPYTSVFSGRVAGSGNNVIGSPALEAGRFRFGVLGQNETTSIEIVNDSPLPCAFLGAEWEALYVIRSQRL